METRQSVEFVGDTAVMKCRAATASSRQNSPRRGGTFPYQFYVMGLMEQMGRSARGVGKDSVRFSAIFLRDPDQRWGPSANVRRHARPDVR